MSSEKYLRNIWYVLLFMCIVMVFWLLYVLHFIFVPIVTSFFVVILINWIYSFFQKHLKSKALSIITTVWIFVWFIFIVWFIINNQIWDFMKNSEKFSQWFENILTFFNQYTLYFDIDLTNYWNMPSIKKWFSWLNYWAIWRTIYGAFATFSALFLTTVVFVLFIFLEIKNLKEKVIHLFDVKWARKFQTIFMRISSDLNIYFSTKFFLATLNGTVAMIVMSIFWLDFALTFALIVFFMDFIPIIWAIIALWLPFLYSLVTFGNVWMSLLMLLCLYIPQIITANFMEPKIMWDRLNISPLTLIIALLFWWHFWWIMWAFLAVPIMATFNIVLSKFEHTRFISVMISQETKK